MMKHFCGGAWTSGLCFTIVLYFMLPTFPIIIATWTLVNFVLWGIAMTFDF